MATQKKINLALQGGGSHGAFTWGVLDRLLEDERIDIEGISATSAGTMNAVCFAYGLTVGGREGAKETLETFWRKISESGETFSPIKRLPWQQWPAPWGNFQNLSYDLFDATTRMLSPYQFNPFDINPLRDILDDTVLKTCNGVKLFISTTRVRTGKVRVFNTDEISLDVAMASACLPQIYKAVEVDDDYYWDGGYTANPALFPFFYHTDCHDILIVHINPLERDEIPTTADEIANRVNEISFNSSLLKEMRAIAFVHKLIDQDWLKDEHKDKLNYMLVHSLRADEAMREFDVMSKFDTDWGFLTYLRGKGYRVMDSWLERHFDALNKHSTVNLKKEFLDIGSEHVG